MGLCFGFVMKRVLVTDVLITAEQRLHSTVSFFASHCPTSEEAGGAQGVERAHGWDS